MKRSAGFLRGKLTTEGTNENEVIDIGELFGTGAKLVFEESSKIAEDSRSEQKKAQANAARSAKRATVLASLGVLMTAVALSLLSLAAAQSAWVFLQK